MKVLIIGAGPAGCALAHGLKKSNIPFAIFDKASSAITARNWAFTLGWARPYLLELLPPDLGAQLTSAQCDPQIDCAAMGQDRIVVFDGQTREEAFVFPIPDAKEINIRQLRDLLSDGLDVHYSRQFVDFDLLGEGDSRTVRAIFDDGTSVEGDVIVGVDGAGSKVRQCLLGDKGVNESLPFALMNFNTKYTAAQAQWLKERLHPLVDIAIHPAGHYIRMNVLDMPDAEDASTWTFQVLSTWAFKNVEDYDNEDKRVQRLKSLVRKVGWAEPYKSAIEWMPEDTEILRDRLKIWKTVKWDNQGGRVTLCGDAAHAMTFHRGQGANNALYDSFTFVEAMKNVQSGKLSLEQGISEYDEKIIERGKREVQISKAQTFFTHNWEDFKKSPVMQLGTRPSHVVNGEGKQ